jgi:ubiquinol-cytochrome c reductase iron-sulfur subunit
MSTVDDVDLGRRRFLTATATVVGGVGVAFVAVPFLSSWAPSERAQAAGAPVEADISKLEEGALMTVEWRGRPVWLLKRSPRMLDDLPGLRDLLRDPDSAEVGQQPPYAQNAHRSIRPDLLVMIGICTHLGCSPTFRPEIAPADLGPNWRGGFFCPCHGSGFDLAGRVFRGVPAPLNMEVPSHRFLSDSRVLIGVDPETA